MNRWVLGVDFGRQSDRTAIAAVEVVPQSPDAEGRAQKAMLDVRYLDRRPVGESYPSQCAVIAALVHTTDELVRAEIVCDATGVGTAVIDQLVEHLGRQVVSLTITGGSKQKFDGNRWSIPKRDLAASLAIAMQQRRVRVSRGLPEAENLFAELANFSVSVSESGHDTYEAAGGGHDDLVLSASYAIFAAERGGGPASVWLEYMRRKLAGEYGGVAVENDSARIPESRRVW